MDGVKRLGICGLGVFLPPTVRTNDHWSAEVVEKWRSERTWSPERYDAAVESHATPGVLAMLNGMRTVAGDPFQGSTVRHVISDGMTAVDMGAEAARAAIQDSGLDPTEIDLMLGSSLVPDHINAPDVCGVHHSVGLRRDCLVIGTDNVCNSWQIQLSIAEGLLRSGARRYALLVQTSAPSRVTPHDASFGVHFGDGAAAAVVRLVDRGGLRGQAFRVDGSALRAQVCTVPGKAWWEDGRIVSYTEDRASARDMFLLIADRAKELIGEALRNAGLKHQDVGFFAGHQPTSWWRRAVQDFSGLAHAKSFDTYPEAGTISAGNIPFILLRARERNLIPPGTIVAMFQGGTGQTLAASVYEA